jgi:tubulin-specific chaperone E
MESFSVGSRIRDVADGTRGTVRYIGPVAAAKNKTEMWLGVEWDVQGRGKHDGSCIDDAGTIHRYFLCPMGDGSFVKPNKVTAGRMLISALRERYVSHDAPEITGPDSVLPDAYVVTAKGNQKSIEFVGEKKLR